MKRKRRPPPRIYCTSLKRRKMAPKSRKEEFNVILHLNEAKRKKSHDPHYFSSYCKTFTKKDLEKFLSEFYTDTSQRRKQDVIEFILYHFQKPFEFLTEGIKIANSSCAMNFHKRFEKASCAQHLEFGGFWHAGGYEKCHQKEALKWWNPSLKSSTLEATVHFVQVEGGTGVHIGNGFILTCAHVILFAEDGDEDEDDENEEEGNSSSPGISGGDEEKTNSSKRIGRKKIVLFCDQRAFVATCIKCVEDSNKLDLVLLKIENPPSDLPKAEFSDKSLKVKENLFCVGYPNDADLETNQISNCFKPRGWHLSIGAYQGNSKKYGLGGFAHSCWTYWGHSGAPIFNEKGKFISLHNSWDPENGLRHGVGQNTIKNFLVDVELN